MDPFVNGSEKLSEKSLQKVLRNRQTLVNPQEITKYLYLNRSWFQCQFGWNSVLCSLLVVLRQCLTLTRKVLENILPFFCVIEEISIVLIREFWCQGIWTFMRKSEIIDLGFSLDSVQVYMSLYSPFFCFCCNFFSRPSKKFIILFQSDITCDNFFRGCLSIHFILVCLNLNF